MSRKLTSPLHQEPTARSIRRPSTSRVEARRRIKLGEAAGLTQFGVNLCTLPPGAWSSQRHWHTKGDELIYVVSGEVVLVTDEGEDTLRAGDSAGFKAGDRSGHHFQNRSASDAVIMEIGTRVEGDEAFYPDIDLRTVAGQGTHTATVHRIQRRNGVANRSR